MLAGQYLDTLGEAIEGVGKREQLLLTAEIEADLRGELAQSFGRLPVILGAIFLVVGWHPTASHRPCRLVIDPFESPTHMRTN
jgi:hypothetical protein